MFGYHGRYLKVDAGSGLAALQPLDEAVLRWFLGGVGLGTWVVAREAPAGADPLGIDATLVFALSPLVGTQRHPRIRSILRVSYVASIT